MSLPTLPLGLVPQHAGKERGFRFSVDKNFDISPEWRRCQLSKVKKNITLSSWNGQVDGVSWLEYDLSCHITPVTNFYSVAHLLRIFFSGTLPRPLQVPLILPLWTDHSRKATVALCADFRASSWLVPTASRTPGNSHNWWYILPAVRRLCLDYTFFRFVV
jgi:hypothetical protein